MAEFAKPPEGLDIDWDRAKIVVALSDVRGLKKDVGLLLPGGEVRKFEPAVFESTFRATVGEAVEADARQATVSKNYRSFGWMPESRPQMPRSR